MAIKLSEDDHGKLDNLLDGILDAYRAREVSQSQARSALAHVVTAAAIQNEREVRCWLEPNRAKFWKRECGGSYSAMPPASAAKQQPLSQLQIHQPRILALLWGVPFLVISLIDYLRYLAGRGQRVVDAGDDLAGQAVRDDPQ